MREERMLTVRQITTGKWHNLAPDDTYEREISYGVGYKFSIP